MSMSPTEMLSRIRQSLALLQSVQEDLGTDSQFLISTMRRRVGLAIERIEAVLPVIEATVQYHSPRVQLKCDYENKGATIYSCDTITCPVHGERNKIMISPSTRIRKMEN